jgi:hypothetical protein
MASASARVRQRRASFVYTDEAFFVHPNDFISSSFIFVIRNLSLRDVA